MDFDQIQALWAAQPDPPEADQERLKKVMVHARRLNRRATVRDYVELITALGMAGLFAWVASVAPVVWPWVMAAVITMGVGMVFVRERLRGVPGVGPTDVRRDLERAIAQVDHQIRLLGSVVRWYLAPLGVVVALSLVGTLLGVRAEVGPEVWARGRGGFAGVFAAVVPLVGGVFAFVWWLNRRAVTDQLLPHREQLVQSLNQLTEAAGSGDEET